MSQGWFALGGTALGALIAGGIALLVARTHQRGEEARMIANRRFARNDWQRETVLQLQTALAAFADRVEEVWWAESMVEPEFVPSRPLPHLTRSAHEFAHEVGVYAARLSDHELRDLALEIRLQGYKVLNSEGSRNPDEMRKLIEKFQAAFADQLARLD